MSRTVQISVNRADGTRLDMPATLADDEVMLLEEYLSCADQLWQLKIVRQGIPTSFELKIRDDKVESIHSEIPPDADIAALLHRLRPFILQEERTGYLNVSGLLGARFEHPHLRQLLKEQRRLFDSRNNQELVRVTSNGTIINCEQTLFDWLNGYEYHRDQAKREKIESLHRLIPLEHSMPILLNVVGDKVKAVFELATLIPVILGREESVQVVRRGSQTDIKNDITLPR
ncbi:MAG TPA: hypothetical protein VGQ21_16825 [Thermoanaerobaculia bacterium]|nr:hypothetical protein [Thermoanaerobaculia bacterium]